jgi:hypothetical protein
MGLPSLCYSGDGLSRSALARQLVTCVGGHIEPDCGDWEHLPTSNPKWVFACHLLGF